MGNLKDGHVGNMFLPIPSTSINLSDRIASEMAKQMRSTVWVINIGFFAKSITHWLPGSSAPDAFANIRANVHRALAIAGVARIKYLFWWQGETPTDQPDLYPQQFDDVMTRFKAEPWFPRDTPVTVFGVAPSRISKNANSDHYNDLLRKAVDQEPATRRFLSTSFLDESLWLDTGHPNGGGFDVVGKTAGALAAERLISRPMPLTP